ncbi:MAG: AI-2E family transporter, partial [Solirubrobacterales bacterium]|nr:AI-2E family transporter [Solirubrobacterales bacterium]
MKKYPTQWQHKTMWASLTAIFVVVLFLIVGTIIYIGASLVAFLQPILIPVAIAAILAYLLDPLVTYLARRGFGRTKAVLTIFAIAFLGIAGLCAWIVPLISVQSASLARQLPAFTERTRDYVVDLIYRYEHTFGVSSEDSEKGAATGLINWLLAGPTPTPAPNANPKPAASPSSMSGEVIAPSPTKLSSADRERIRDWVQKQLPAVEKQLPDLVSKLWLLIKTSIGGFLGVTGFLLSLVMVPIYSFFLLKERPSIESRWREYLPLRNSPLKDEVATTLSQINSYLIAYFRGQLLVCVVDGLLIGTALTIFGLNFAPLIGLIVIPLTMIPYLGIVICWIPAVLIAAAQWGDWWHPFGVTIIFIVVQNLEGLFYAPRIVGNSVGLHPMTVIVSIFIWGLLIGGLLGP